MIFQRFALIHLFRYAPFLQLFVRNVSKILIKVRRGGDRQECRCIFIVYIEILYGCLKSNYIFVLENYIFNAAYV